MSRLQKVPKNLQKVSLCLPDREESETFCNSGFIGLHVRDIVLFESGMDSTFCLYSNGEKKWVAAGDYERNDEAMVDFLARQLEREISSSLMGKQVSKRRRAIREQIRHRQKKKKARHPGATPAPRVPKNVLMRSYAIEVYDSVHRERGNGKPLGGWCSMCNGHVGGN